MHAQPKHQGRQRAHAGGRASKETSCCSRPVGVYGVLRLLTQTTSWVDVGSCEWHLLWTFRRGCLPLQTSQVKWAFDGGMQHIYIGSYDMVRKDWNTNRVTFLPRWVYILQSVSKHNVFSVAWHVSTTQTKEHWQRNLQLGICCF